jgi:hypothetical protein
VLPTVEHGGAVFYFKCTQRPLADCCSQAASSAAEERHAARVASLTAAACRLQRALDAISKVVAVASSLVPHGHSPGQMFMHDTSANEKRPPLCQLPCTADTHVGSHVTDSQQSSQRFRRLTGLLETWPLLNDSGSLVPHVPRQTLCTVLSTSPSESKRSCAAILADGAKHQREPLARVGLACRMLRSFTECSACSFEKKYAE